MFYINRVYTIWRFVFHFHFLIGNRVVETTSLFFILKSSDLLCRRKICGSHLNTDIVRNLLCLPYSAIYICVCIAALCRG